MDWSAFTNLQWDQIALYLTGLFACYFAGLKFGLVIHKIKNMGRFM